MHQRWFAMVTDWARDRLDLYGRARLPDDAASPPRHAQGVS
jgi:hypothetical protein